MNWNVNGGGEFFALLAIAGLVAAAIVNIMFAVGVYQTSSHRAHNGGVLFAPPGVWCLATLLGGVFVAAAFWLIHLSALATQPSSLEAAA